MSYLRCLRIQYVVKSFEYPSSHCIPQSLKVRLSYIDQLRSLDLIPTFFMPSLVSLLSLDGGMHKTFKLDPWAVDEFHVDRALSSVTRLYISTDI